MSEPVKNENSLGRVPPRGASRSPSDTASRDSADNAMSPADVGRVPSHGASSSPSNAASGSASNTMRSGVNEPPPRRLRRLHRVWPDRDGNISYLLTPCVDGRGRILDNEAIFERSVAFLLDSPARYHWFGRRFVVMPDHIHLIAHQGYKAIRVGEWIKALKAVVGGVERREGRPVRVPGLQDAASSDRIGPADVGRVPPHGVPTSSHGEHEFTRIKRPWRWQRGYHDHKFRTRESESRKWEYVCLNPVRPNLVVRPEEWPFCGEVYYDEEGGPRLVRGTPPLLETGILIEEKGKTSRESTRPTTGSGPPM